MQTTSRLSSHISGKTTQPPTPSPHFPPLAPCLPRQSGIKHCVKCYTSEQLPFFKCSDKTDKLSLSPMQFCPPPHLLPSIPPCIPLYVCSLKQGSPPHRRQDGRVSFACRHRAPRRCSSRSFHPYTNIYRTEAAAESADQEVTQ